jgi:hypothetical protein
MKQKYRRPRDHLARSEAGRPRSPLRSDRPSRLCHCRPRKSVRPLWPTRGSAHARQIFSASSTLGELHYHRIQRIFVTTGSRCEAAASPRPATGSESSLRA